MKKILVLIMFMLVLLSSCKYQGKNAETLPSGINPFDTSATSAAKNDPSERGKPIPKGGISWKWINLPNSYNGEPVEASYELLASDTEVYEQGFVVFVEGVPTPFKISVDGEMRDEEAYMHTVLCRNEIVTRVSLYFEPAGFEVRETISYCVSGFFAPSFVPYEYYPVYGHARKLSAGGPLPLKIEAKTKSTVEKTALYPSKEYDIPHEVYKEYESPDGTNALNTNLQMKLCDTDEKRINNILYASGETDFMLKLYGGATTKYRVTLFVNHEPVKVAGKDYLECTLEKGKTAEFNFSLDISGFDRKSTLVAVAVPYGDTYEGLIEHSQAVLLVNTDKPQAQEDIAPPGFFETQEKNETKVNTEPNTTEPDSGNFEKFLQDNRLTLKEYVGNGKYIAYCAINKKHCLVNENEILYYNDHYDTDYDQYEIITLKNGFTYVYENTKRSSSGHDFPSTLVTYIDIYDDCFRLVKQFDASEIFKDYPGHFDIRNIDVSSDGKKICASTGRCLYEYDIEKGTCRTIYEIQRKYGDVGLASFWYIGYSPDDEYITFKAGYYDGRDTLNGHGFIKTDGSGLEYKVIDGTDIEYTVYDKGIFLKEEILPYGREYKGVAYMWEFGTKQPKTVTFLSKNESPSARISKDGSVILTSESLGNETLALVRFRVYAADSMKLLHECELRDYSYIAEKYIAEDGSWFGVNYTEKGSDGKSVQRYKKYFIEKK